MLFLFNSDEPNNIDIDINSIADVIDWLERFRSLIPFIATIIVFCVTLLYFSKKCNGITREQLNSYSDVGKYISGLFVELNESKEHLRAFCYSRLWKKRIIRKYNTLFNDKWGKDLLNVYSERKVILHLPSIYSIKRIKREIENTKEFLRKAERRELTCNPEFTNTNMIYECFGGTYTRTLEQIDSAVSYLGKNFMIITGTAGNGKSMMLCSLAEQLVNGRDTVLFLNARDIKEDFNSYLIKLGVFHKEKHVYAWWKLQGFLHLISNRYIYIIVDAINENNTESFLESFSKHVERLLKCNHIKVIVSCRSEYFDAKYKKYLITSRLEQNACKINLQEDKYTAEAKERLLSNYAQHYGFSGELSESVKEKLTGQLLLVRIFFEIYANKSDKVFDLNKFELYKKYIESTDNLELRDLIKNLTKYMFENKQYTNIPLGKITKVSTGYELIDSSILICRTIITDKGKLHENSQEVINFVYDEMRDYLLAKHMLLVCTDKNGNVDYSKVKKNVQDLKNQGSQCLEGIVNYLFCHCVSEDIPQMINYFLFNVIKLRDDQIDAFANRRNRQITSWGLSLLFETDSIKTSYGKKYVDYILQDNPGKEGQKLLVYLLNQEASNGKYTLDILLDSFSRAVNTESFKTRVINTIASWPGEGVTVNRLIEIYEKLKTNNIEGAKRFAVYSYLLTSVIDCKDRTKIQTLFKDIGSQAISFYSKPIRKIFK